MDHGEEVAAEFFESRGQSSHVFHGAEETLNNVAHFVETNVMRDGFSGVAFFRNDRERPVISNKLADVAGAVSLVGNDGKRCGGGVEKLGHDLTVMDLTAGDDQAPGTAAFIDDGVDLARATAA